MQQEYFSVLNFALKFGSQKAIQGVLSEEEPNLFSNSKSVLLRINATEIFLSLYFGLEIVKTQKIIKGLKRKPICFLK